jgi:hypothetical protein
VKNDEISGPWICRSAWGRTIAKIDRWRSARGRRTTWHALTTPRAPLAQWGFRWLACQEDGIWANNYHLSCARDVLQFISDALCAERCARAQISAPRHCKSLTLARPLSPFCRSLFGTGEIQLFALDIPFLQAPVLWPRVWFTRQHWAIKSFARTNGSKIKYPPPCTFTFPLFRAAGQNLWIR